MFEHVVCGVDGSDEGLEAARQAARLASGSLTLVAAIDPWDLTLAGEGTPSEAAPEEPPGAAGGLRALAEEALAVAEGAIETSGEVTRRLVEGRPADVLILEARRVGATLLVVGTHGRGRLPGVVLGSVATAIVHRAPCSVLVARPATGAGGAFPSSVVVGVDASPESSLALASARAIRDRFAVGLRAVACSGSRGLDLDAAREMVLPDELEVEEGRPVEGLVSAAPADGILAVGSRGLQGIRALGSVSERVVHAAPSSVLVVRVPSTAAPARAAHRAVVRDVMSAPVTVAAEDATVDELARLMLEHGIGAVPIVDAGGRIVGLVTESDFLGKEAVLASSRYGHETRLPKLFGEWVYSDEYEGVLESVRARKALDVMSTPVLVGSEDEPVQQALERMLHHRVGHLPVVRGGVPVGMLAARDLLGYAARVFDDGETRETRPG